MVKSKPSPKPTQPQRGIVKSVPKPKLTQKQKQKKTETEKNEAFLAKEFEKLKKATEQQMDKSVEDIKKKSQELDEESRKLEDKYKSLTELPITAINEALKDAVKTYEIDLKNKNDPLI